MATDKNGSVFPQSDADDRGRPMAAVLPIMGFVLVGFLVIGIAMPVLPLHVHGVLGLGTFIVGLVAGSQFAVSLISRPWAGIFADSRGAKRAVVLGLLAAAGAGLLYLLSLRFVGAPTISVAILLIGRLMLGAAESFIITGGVSWGLARVSRQDTGRVIAWVGAAMFAAFAIGAPIGSALYARYGFAAIAVATTLAPLVTVVWVAFLRPVLPLSTARPAFFKVAGAVWVPGLGSALSSVGFGAITAFMTLLFVNRGWSQGWLAYTAFAGAFIVARLVFGHLPDRLGGARIALICVLIEAVGQALIWLAPRPELALVGAVLSGFGYSLVYPGLGVEAVRRVPPQNRGLAMGAYTAFLDIALGFGTPALGLVASAAGLSFVFLISALAALGSAIVALSLYLRQNRSAFMSEPDKSYRASTANQIRGTGYLQRRDVKVRAAASRLSATEIQRKGNQHEYPPCDDSLAVPHGVVDGAWRTGESVFGADAGRHTRGCAGAREIQE